MNDQRGAGISDSWVVSSRGNKNRIDPDKPYAYLSEKERTQQGTIEETNVIFLTNRECPFHCLMCDLWKNATSYSLPLGVIPKQIEWALGRLPSARNIKLYNSGSFFDPKAIPVRDYERIASILKEFDNVVVECHPRLVNSRCIEFRNLLRPGLQVALGLETINPEVLGMLNKQMNADDFRNAVRFLSDNGIGSRAFILLKPPFMSEEEGIYWAERSIDFAFESGAECCTVIPVRGGNGAMEKLAEAGHFSRPEIRSLEAVTEYGIRLGKGRVFADTWDLELFSACDECTGKRGQRLTGMNLSQEILPVVDCKCNSDNFK